MRLFSAVEIPDKAQSEIAEISKRIETQARVKWVKRENLHITLKFFGEVDESEPIEEILEESVKNTESIDVSLSGVDAFPSKDFVRVIWVGVEKGEEGLISIFKGIEERAEEIGFEKENRDFIPHVTLGRVKRGKMKLPKIKFNYNAFRVNNITLFKSTLTPGGPIYRVVKKFNFEQ